MTRTPIAPPHRIDVHHHVFPPGYVRALRRIGVAQTGGVPLPRWRAERALAIMDRQGIATAVTSISAPGVHFGDAGLARELARECNEFSAGLIRAHPGRFGGFAILPLPDVHAALEELRHALDVLRLDGVVVMTSVDGRYLGDPAFEPLLAELDRRAVPTFVHPNTRMDDEPGQRHSSAVPYPFDSILLKVHRTRLTSLPASMVDWPFETTKAAAGLLLGGALERFPRIPFILSHAGGAVPYLAWRLAVFQERLDLPLRDLAIHGFEMLTHRFKRSPVEEAARGLALLRRLHFDTAFSATPFVFPSLLALVEPSHVLFGTDLGVAAEFVAAETIRGIAEEKVISQDARRMIERGSALALIPRLGAAGEPDGGVSRPSLASAGTG
jgi:predicted TIM-barrel fold metal-dependent hydrolase